MGAKEGKGVAAVVKLYESWEGVIFIVSIRCFCYWIMVIFYGGYIYNIGIGLRKVKNESNQERTTDIELLTL